MATRREHTSTESRELILTAAAELLSFPAGTRAESRERMCSIQSSGPYEAARSFSISRSRTYSQNPSVQSKNACRPGLSGSKCVSTFSSPS